MADKIHVDSPKTLTYLTYFSSASTRFTQTELKQLLEISRCNNEPRLITGLLLYRNGYFLQYLEGPRDIVEETYEHVKRDARHHSVRTTSKGVITARVFPQWSMGYKNLAGIRAATTKGYSECLQPNFHPTDEGDPSKRLADMLYDLTAKM